MIEIEQWRLQEIEVPTAISTPRRSVYAAGVRVNIVNKGTWHMAAKAKRGPIVQRFDVMDEGINATLAKINHASGLVKVISRIVNDNMFDDITRLNTAISAPDANPVLTRQVSEIVIAIRRDIATVAAELLKLQGFLDSLLHEEEALSSNLSTLHQDLSQLIQKFASQFTGLETAVET